MELEELKAINISNMKSFNEEEKLQVLQIWFSNSFPIGAYAYSHGLESMIDDKLINSFEDVHEYIKSIIFYGTCKNDFIFIKSTYQGLDINELALAICASKERKMESLALGNAFRKVLSESWGYKLPINTAFPVAIAKAGMDFNISLKLISTFYLQSFISNLINVCIKHIPLGQKVGQDCLMESIGLINQFLYESKNYSLQNLGSICFNSDMHSIKHENLFSRVYSS